MVMNYLIVEGYQKGAEKFSKETGIPTFGWDVSDYNACAEGVKKVRETLGAEIDVLVNNAGITRDNLLVRLSEDDWDSVLDTNLKSAYLCSKAAARGMIRLRQGCILNIASVIALIGNAGQANYTAAKGGLIALTKSMARELGSRNIRVNAIAPGFIETDMTVNLTAAARQQLTDRLILGQLGQPEDIAMAAGYLCSPAARYVTGQVLSVDGGLSLS